MAQRLNRIERIGKAVPASGLWHELCDARSALWAHGAGTIGSRSPIREAYRFSRIATYIPRWGIWLAAHLVESKAWAIYRERAYWAPDRRLDPCVIRGFAHDIARSG